MKNLNKYYKLKIKQLEYERCLLYQELFTRLIESLCIESYFKCQAKDEGEFSPIKYIRIAQ